VPQMTSPLLAGAPPAGDRELLSFAQGAELAVHDLYLVAAESSRVDTEAAAAMRVFAEQHLAVAQAIAGLIGSDAPNARAESVYASFRAAAASAPFETMQALENTLAATHTDLLGRIESLDAATMVASVISVTARRAAVFGVLPSLSLPSALDNPAVSIAPAVGS
jgi:hypothetical protein